MKRFSIAFIMLLAMLVPGLLYGETVTNVHNMFKDDFPGTSILTSKWGAPTLAGSANYSVSASNLVVTLTTSATDSFTLTSKDPIVIPNRITFGLTLSARSTNQEVLLQAATADYISSGGTSGHAAQWKFNGTTATTGNTRVFNNGTGGADTARTIATTATASLFQITMGIDDVRFSQTTVDNAGAKNGIFVHNVKLPDPKEPYYLQVIVRNTGASTALTATVDFVSVQTVAEMMVEVAGGTGDSTGALAMPVNVIANGASSTSQVVQGQAAHDAAVSGSPVRIGGRAMTSNYAAVASGDQADQVVTLVGAQIGKPFSIPELDWGATDQITNSTTAAQLKAAGGAGIKNYVTGLTIAHAALGAASEFVIRSTPIASTTATIASNTLVMAGTYNWKIGDMVQVTASTVTGLSAGSYYYILTVSGANLTFSATRGGTTLAISGSSVNATLAKVLFRSQLQTAALPMQNVIFPNPVSGGDNLAVEALTVTATTTGRVDFNVQGYQAP